MEKSLIHSNELHFISKKRIHQAVEKMVEQLIDFFSFFQIREIALHYCIDVEAGCGTRSQIQ